MLDACKTQTRQDRDRLQSANMTGSIDASNIQIFKQRTQATKKDSFENFFVITPRRVCVN